MTSRENRAGTASLSACGWGLSARSSAIKAPWPEPSGGQQLRTLLPGRAPEMALALWVFGLLDLAFLVSANIFGEF